MDEDVNDLDSTPGLEASAGGKADELDTLRRQYESRLVAANLRTEAVRAGMIDLVGLKLVDLATVRLNSDDTVNGGRQLMDDLRRSKPWLFNAGSSSSAAVAPASQPVRQKTALEMTDDEYTAARATLIKQRF